MLGETRQHREARLARQAEKYPELAISTPTEVFNVDRYLREQGQTPTTPGQEVESAYFANLQRFREVDRATPIPELQRGPTSPWTTLASGITRGAQSMAGAISSAIETVMEAEQIRRGAAPQLSLPMPGGLPSLDYTVDPANLIPSVLETRAPEDSNIFLQEALRPANYLAPLAPGLSFAPRASLPVRTAAEYGAATAAHGAGTAVTEATDNQLLGVGAGLLAGGLAGFGTAGLAGVARSADQAIGSAAIRQAEGPLETSTRGGLRSADPIDVPLGDALESTVRTYSPSPGAVDVNHQRLPNGTPTGAEAIGTPSVIFDYARPVRPVDEVLQGRSDAARAYAQSQARNGENVRGGIVDALETARATVDIDAPGAVRRFAGTIPVLRNILDWDRPGLVMPKRLLESHIASTGTYATLRSEQGAVRNNINTSIDQIFGRGASEGQPVLYGARKDVDTAHQIIINGNTVEYPASGTVLDFLQRPWAYETTEEMAAIARAWDQADEAFRSRVVENFGADIPRFEPARGGVYVRNVNASDYAKWMSEQSRKGANVGLGDVDERVWDNAFVRWADGQNRVSRGALKPDQAFVPETNLRLIGDTEDSLKAAAARDLVLRAGIDAKTATEVKEAIVPGLVARRDNLRRNVENIASRIRNAEQRVRTDAAVVRQLDRQYQQTTSRIENLQGQAARTAERTKAPSLEDARAALSEAHATLRQSITELRRAGIDAPTPRQATRQVDDIFRRADEAQAEADSILNQMLDTFEPGTTSVARKPLDIVAKAQAAADNAIAAALDAEQQILARVTRAQAASQDVEAARMLVREGESGLESAWRTEDKLTSFDSAINELQRRADSLYDTIARTTGDADLAASRVESLRTDLAAAREAYKTVQSAYNNVELTGWSGINRMPGRYLPADEARMANSMLAEANYNPVFDFLENLRGQVLTGDAGPMSFIQGVFLAIRQPVGTAKAVAESVAQSVRRGDFLLPYRRETMEQYLRENAEDVAEYAFYVGRMPGGVLPEEVARTGLLGKYIPNFGYANAAMFNVILRRNIDFFKGVRDDLMSAGYTRQEAAAAATDVINKSNPLMTTARLGQSASTARAERLLPTSLAFIRQPIALQNEALGALRKLATPGATPTPKEVLALKVWGRMVGTGIGVGVASAAINAEVRDDSVVDAVADSLDPNSRSFMAFNMGGYSIPLANAFRAPFSLSSGVIRNIVNSVPGVDTGDPQSRDSAINYLTARISPSIQSLTGAYNEFTVAPHERAYSGDSEILRGLSATRIGAQAALPIPAQGMIEEVDRQRTAGEFDPALFIATALAEFGGASLIEEAPMRALDVKSNQEFGQRFEDLGWRDQNKILAQNPDISDKTMRKRREEAQKTLEGSGLFEIEQDAWDLIRSALGIEPKTREEFREDWIKEATDTLIAAGIPDPRETATREYSRTQVERDYSALLQNERLNWASINVSTGLLPIALRHNFIPSNIATRGLAEITE